MRHSVLAAAILAAAIGGCGSDNDNKAGNNVTNSAALPAAEDGNGNDSEDEGSSAAASPAARMQAALVGSWGPEGGCAAQSMAFAADGTVTNTIGEAPGSGQWRVLERGSDVVLHVEINGEADPAIVTLEGEAIRIQPLSGDAGSDGLLLHRC